jgi:hypothetical protein
LLATPETEPVTKITQLLGNKLYCSRSKGEIKKKVLFNKPNWMGASSHPRTEREPFSLCTFTLLHPVSLENGYNQD